MDVFNKLKSAVSTVLPGNPLSKDFDISHQVASAGPGLLWKVFSATKRSTKEEASVYVLEKKSVERYSRRDRDVIIDVLRGGVQQLTKLRHPKILAVIHPLEESRETLAFATEPVFASLSNVLGHVASVCPVPKDLQDYQLYDVEIKHGLMQVTEALCFLHNDAKILHRNLCPESVILTKQGAWKLAGTEFCVKSSDPQSSEPSYPFMEWRSEVVPMAQPNLDYMAPEYVLTMQCGPGSDMFSLGLLVYSIFAKGKLLFECEGELSAFKSNAEEMRHLRVNALGAVPEELRDSVKLLLNTEPAVRPDANQMTKVPWFGDVGCITLQYIDTLFQRHNMDKSNFFKGLAKVITKLPKRVSLQRILPALFKEAVNPDMVPFLLPSIFLIAEQSTDLEFRMVIFPHLEPMMKLKEPVQIVLLFLQHMNLLLSKTPKAKIQSHVLPMLFRALEADSAQIQELCLSIIPTFADLIEYPTLKNSLVPRIKKLCLATTVLTVRVNCLLCLGQLMEYMDKWFVLDEVLPFLHTIPSREPAVLMSMLGIHKVAFEGSKLGITKDALSSKVLPFLIPLAMDNNLSLSQFNAFMSLIRDMLTKMETEHRTKLEQLESMKQEQRSLEISRITGAEGDGISGVVNSDGNNSMMNKFLSGFGLGGFMSGGQSAKSGAGATNSPSPLAQVSSPESPSKSSAPVPVPSKKLSIEEKQRLAQQQEQQQRFKAQPSLLSPSSSSSPKPSPTPTPAKASSTATKDLTSTLMQSNVNAMDATSLGPNRTPQPSYSSSGWANNTPGAGGGSGGGFSMGSGMGGSPFGAQMNSPIGMGQSMSMWTRTANKPDLSTFDSLLTTPSSKAKQPMNSMRTTTNSNNSMRTTNNSNNSMRTTTNSSNNSSAGAGGAMPGNAMGMGLHSMGMMPNSMGMMPNSMGFNSMGMNTMRNMMSGQAQMGMMTQQNSAMGAAMFSPTPSSQKPPNSNSLDDLLG